MIRETRPLHSFCSVCDMLMAVTACTPVRTVLNRRYERAARCKEQGASHNSRHEINKYF